MHSMTAFARCSVKLEGWVLTCEMRSVNHRYLDLTVKTPDCLRELEADFRSLIKATLNRGKVECYFDLSSDKTQSQEIRINEPVVKSLKAAADQIDELLERSTQYSAFRILRWPGVVKEQGANPEVAIDAAQALLQETLDKFVAMRKREADDMIAAMREKLVLIDSEVELVSKKIPEIVQTHRERLHERCSELLAEIDSSRLEQELLHFSQKLDVAEEMDRLKAHLREVDKILKEGGVAGRRLDFLMQELNREANTLSSKSVDTQTTQAAVEMKVLIEQMREQAQNIE